MAWSGSRVPVNAEELSEPHIISALNDYELVREEDQYYLRLRASLRLKALLALTEFVVPKIRNDEPPVPQQIVVQILKFSEPSAVRIQGAYLLAPLRSTPRHPLLLGRTLMSLVQDCSIKPLRGIR